MTRDKVFSLEELAKKLNQQRTEKTIVLCHGVFDIIHPGHVMFFEEARGLGDILVGTVTPDKFVNKGSHQPLFNENERVLMVSAQESVTCAAINEWATAVETISLLKPDFYCKGGEYVHQMTPALEREIDTATSVGCKAIFLSPNTHSSTDLIRRLERRFPMIP